MQPRRELELCKKPSRARAASLAPLLLASAASALQGGALPPSPTGPCGPATIEAGRLRPGAAVFRLEGLIQGYDTALRLITTNDCEFRVPPGVLLDVDGDEIGDIDFAFAFDPVLEQQHTLLGGTVIARGHLVRGAGFCWELEADAVEILFAEHVLLGPLTKVSAGDQRFVVNATDVKLNTDPRFPSRLLGLGGEPVTISDLYGFVGSLASVEGYFENGALRATVVETAAWIPHPSLDTVIVERATWDPSKEAIDVRGFVSRQPATGALVPFVSVFAGAENPGGGCGGTLAGTAYVTFDATMQLGQFRYRSPDHAYPARPPVACAQSAGGGSDEIPVD